MLFAKLFLLAAFCAVAFADWKNCGSSSDALQIQNLVVPGTLTPGQPISISFSGTLSEQLTGGNVVISVTFLGITVFSKTYDLCKLVSEGGSSCPVAAGPLSISKQETMPSGAPRGTYQGKVVVHDQSGSEVTCIEFGVKIEALNMNSPVHDDIQIKYINSVQTEWTAAHNARFEGVTVGEVKKMLRTRLANPLTVVPVSSIDVSSVDLPATFDARQQWPTCIHPIRDQQQCGSCWAFSASEVLTDRFCIASKGATNVVLSPQFLVSCDTSNYGCDGGYLDLTWQFMEQTGLVTDACLPYTSGGGDSGTCPNACIDGSSFKYYKVVSGSTTNPTALADIQTALVTSGPVQAAFSVYQDFMSYSGGVYSHVSGSLLGGHAVKFVGYGTYNNIPYWLVANSWGTSWGIQGGFFMIKRGNNECGIESSIYYGQAAV
jgi:cathepsin B